MNVSTAQPEELVSEADDIIREVIQESNFTRASQVSMEDVEKADTILNTTTLPDTQE